MRFLSLATAASLLLLAPRNVVAWSDLGHRTVALLAQKYLDADTIQALDKILVNDKGYDFSDAAVWADTIKRGKHARPYTKPWHYIDAIDVGEDKESTPTGCQLNYPSDCTHQGPNGCIITAISNQTSLFLSPDSSGDTRREALMFLMHFFGDLHQPLHIEDAFTGGNNISVCFRRACSDNNLHSVWDKYIPNKLNGVSGSLSDDEEKAAAADWADRLFTLNEAAGVSAEGQCAKVLQPDTCSLAWARETNKWICKYVLQPNVAWLESHDLSLEYYDGAAPIVEELIGKAGARLGAWLTGLHAQMVANGLTRVGKAGGMRGGRKENAVAQEPLGKEEM